MNIDGNQGFITKRYILESLENNESNSELCESILELILEYPLQKYSKPMLLTNEQALNEIKKITKVMRDIITTDNTSYSKLLNISDPNSQNIKYASDFDAGIGILLIHISAVFCRIMVEIFLNLSNEIEPHIEYWTKTGLKYQKQGFISSSLFSSSSVSTSVTATASAVGASGNASIGSGSGPNGSDTVSPVPGNKIITGNDSNLKWRGFAKPESLKSIALRRARVFKKLKQDLMIQTGHLQWWYYGLANVEKLTETHEFDDIKPFIAEMRDLFQIDENNGNSTSLNTNTNATINANANNIGVKDNDMMAMGGGVSGAVGSGIGGIGLLRPDRIRLLESLLETMIKSEAFVVKLEHDIKLWGMPPYWKQNFKTYALRAFGVIAVSGIIYYKFPLIMNYVNKVSESLQIFLVDHTIEPLKVMYSEVFDNSALHQKEINVESLKNEAESLQTMIRDYEMNNNKTSSKFEIMERAKNEDMRILMDVYEKDIHNPIHSITKGTLLTNILIQIQKMKVEVSRLLVGVDDLIDANRFNLELIALIPGIMAVWGSLTFAKDVLLRKTRYYKQIESLGIPGYNLGAKPDLKELRRLFRQIHSLLVKNLSATYLGYEDCGIMLHLLYKLSKWGNMQLLNAKLSREENEWLQLDIHHFISREFSIDQLLAQLRRMENYYLRL